MAAAARMAAASAPEGAGCSSCAGGCGCPLAAAGASKPSGGSITCAAVVIVSQSMLFLSALQFHNRLPVLVPLRIRGGAQDAQG